VRIERQLLELLTLHVRHEPEVGAGRAALRLHRTGDELSVGAARGEHGGLDTVDERVQVVELLLEGDFAGHVMTWW